MAKEKDAPAAEPPVHRPADRPAPTVRADETDGSVAAAHERIGNAGVVKSLRGGTTAAVSAVQEPLAVHLDPREPWQMSLPPGITMDVLLSSLYGTTNVPLGISFSWYDDQPRLTLHPALLRPPYRALYDSAMAARKAQLDAECRGDYQELKERIRLYTFIRSRRPVEIVERWAHESFPYSGRGSYLDHLLDLCWSAIIDTGTFIQSDRTVYELMFDEYPHSDDLAEIRDRYSRWFKGVQPEKAFSLPRELGSRALSVPIGVAKGLKNAAVGVASTVKEGGLMLYDLYQIDRYLGRERFGLRPEEPVFVSAMGKAAQNDQDGSVTTSSLLKGMGEGLIDAPKRVVQGIVELDPEKATAALTELAAFVKIAKVKVSAPAVVSSVVKSIASLPGRIPGVKPLTTALEKVMTRKITAPPGVDKIITGIAAAPGEIAAAVAADLRSHVRNAVTAVLLETSQMRANMQSPYVSSASEPAWTQPKADVSPKPAAAAEAPVSADDAAFNATVDDAFAEYQGRQYRVRKPSLRRVAKTAQADATRDAFNGAVRDAAAQALQLVIGQVHHAIEIQAMSRYPGVFGPTEINSLGQMRGIPSEKGGRQQLHGSKIREVIDNHYRGLDAEIARRGLQPGTFDYEQTVRRWLGDAQRQIDWALEAFFSERLLPVRPR